MSRVVGLGDSKIGYADVVYGSLTCHTSTIAASTRKVDDYEVTKENGFVVEERPSLSRRSMDDAKRKSKMIRKNSQLNNRKRKKTIARRKKKNLKLVTEVRVSASRYQSL